MRASPPDLTFLSRVHYSSVLFCFASRFLYEEIIKEVNSGVAFSALTHHCYRVPLLIVVAKKKKKESGLIGFIAHKHTKDKKTERKASFVCVKASHQ